MGTITDQLQRLDLGAVELKDMNGWKDGMIEDYLGIDENFQTLGSAVETIAAVTDPPTLATDPGTAGNIAFDSSYLYICIATATWKRVAISTW